MLINKDVYWCLIPLPSQPRWGGRLLLTSHSGEGFWLMLILIVSMLIEESSVDPHVPHKKSRRALLIIDGKLESTVAGGGGGAGYELRRGVLNVRAAVLLFTKLFPLLLFTVFLLSDFLGSRMECWGFFSASGNYY